MAQALTANPTRSGRSAARLARLLREQEVESSNLSAPTTFPPRDHYRDHTRTLPRALLVVCVCLLLGAPAAVRAGDDPVYTVRKGDSLSLIAQRVGVTLAHIRQANGLKGDVIHADQALKIPDAFKKLRPVDVRWKRPLPKGGKVIRPFGPYQQGKLVLPSTGTDIACPPGTKVTAPANGVVRHVGSMDGVGTVLILEHGGSWTSVLAPLDADTITVRVGQIVLRGDVLAQTAPPEAAGDQPHLHVELRRDNKAVAPDRLLK
jgi:murein DD-endopeptidase MepM/ murein hydrolase activator NlpD